VGISVFGQLGKDIDSSVAPVGKFDTFGAAVGTCGNDIFSYFKIPIVKDRDKTYLFHCC
jgi:hypothetical protein